MHGNVAEWVVDGYDPNYYDGIDDKKNPVFFAEELYPRIVRGGSYNQEPAELRSASRSFSEPKWKRRDPQFPKSLWWLTDATHVGFRIVRPKEVPSKVEMEKYWGKPIVEY
jgi:formylglycine-generating enzyme required for sulfatase activity